MTSQYLNQHTYIISMRKWRCSSAWSYTFLAQTHRYVHHCVKQNCFRHRLNVLLNIILSITLGAPFTIMVLTEMNASVSKSKKYFLTEMITGPCHGFITKLSLWLGHGWVITTHRIKPATGIQLAIISKTQIGIISRTQIELARQGVDVWRSPFYHHSWV